MRGTRIEEPRSSESRGKSAKRRYAVILRQLVSKHGQTECSSSRQCCDNMSAVRRGVKLARAASQECVTPCSGSSRPAPLLKERWALAPMMGYTDPHYRQLIRSVAGPEAVLYTEMISASELWKAPNRAPDWLRRPTTTTEKLTVLQLGGSCSDQLGHAAKLVSQLGYRAINLNCGCPSNQVAGHGGFGAALMLQPELTRELCERMSEHKVPVSVKCRLGVQRSAADQVDRELVYRFIEEVSKAGVTHFVIHARTAILEGLSAKDNRNIPPLQYEEVFRLAEHFGSLSFTINGGIETMADSTKLLAATPSVSGVMVGRAVNSNPWEWRSVGRELHGSSLPPQMLQEYAAYAEQEESTGTNARHLVKPLHTLFRGEPGGARFRKELGEGLKTKQPVGDLIRVASSVVDSGVLHQH